MPQSGDATNALKMQKNGATRAVTLTACLVLTAAVPAHSRAQSETFALEYAAVPECPTRDVFLERVRAHAMTSSPSASEVSVNLAVAQASSENVLTLRVSRAGASTTRTLRGPNCNSLVDAAAIIVAFAVDEASAETSLTRAETTATNVESAAPTAVTRRESNYVAVDARTREPEVAPFDLWRALFVSARAVVEAGTLPHAAFGIAAELGIHVSRLELRVGVDLVGPVEATLPDSNQGGSFSRAAFAARLGYRLVDRRFTLTPYAGIQIGRITGTGVGIADPEVVYAAWNSPFAGLAFAVVLTQWLSAELSLQAQLPNERFAFEVHRVGTLYRVSPVCAETQLGISVRLP